MNHFGHCPTKKLTFMKKFLTSLLFLAAFAVMPASAQFKFGIKGGLNNSNMTINYENLTNKSGYGWFIGPTLKGTLPLGLVSIGADVSAFYDQRRSKTELDGIETSIKQQSVFFPVNVRADISLAKVFGVYVATGPQFGFNVGKNYVDLGSSSSIKEHFQLRKSQFSWNIGAGIMALKHLEIGFTYNIGIGKTGELRYMTEDDIRDAPKQKSWTVSAAYYF